MGNIHTVGPNESLVVSGGCCGSTRKALVVGGWLFRRNLPVSSPWVDWKLRVAWWSGEVARVMIGGAWRRRSPMINDQ